MPISSSSTEKFVNIATIRDNCVILKDGSLRAVLMVSGINFDLLSDTEQEVIINAYQSLLNSLDFSLQILIHSRKVNMNNYLEEIKYVGEKETNELLRLQIEEYYNFIEELVRSTNIMVKRFYVVIPYSSSPIISAAGGGLEPILSKLPFGKKTTPQEKSEKKELDFENQKMQLYYRVNAIISALKPMGLNAIRLKTADLIELYYNFYNPEKQERKNLAIASELDAEYEEYSLE
ncbi:MAG: hypothetical protein PHF40_01340 [Candidatus Pacebacteria bacterium]|nr:hypothetical protein [Candidatus Paceibacterota bacterium]